MATTTPSSAAKKETKHVPAHPTAAHAAVSHATKPGRYTEAVGRRKTAIARVRIMKGDGKVTVNGKDLKHYFVLARHAAAARSPLDQLKLVDFDVTVHVAGGGIHSQADAIRLGLSRAIVAKDPEWKPRLRTIGFMTRDSRMVERKKYGKKKARRSPQWAKR
jgi:small subunit ribosomal protein S9